MFKKIMVATDGSQTSIRTAELAVGLARLSGGSISPFMWWMFTVWPIFPVMPPFPA
jgi:Universal stress protein UspA and related nucleotide-binding proteins